MESGEARASSGGCVGPTPFIGVRQIGISPYWLGELESNVPKVWAAVPGFIFPKHLLISRVNRARDILDIHIRHSRTIWICWFHLSYFLFCAQDRKFVIIPWVFWKEVQISWFLEAVWWGFEIFLFKLLLIFLPNWNFWSLVRTSDKVFQSWNFWPSIKISDKVFQRRNFQVGTSDPLS